MTVWIQNPFDNLLCEGYRKQRYWMMSEAFAAAGHRVVFWTSDFSHASKRRRQIVTALPTQFELRMIPTRPYARNVSVSRVRSHRAYAAEWIRLGRTADTRPDVIISSMPTISTAAAALTLGHELGAKVVVDVMDAWPETFERLAPDGLPRGIAKLALSPLRAKARRVYREADLVTGVCERYRELSGREDYYLAYHGVEIGANAATAQVSRTGDAGGVRLVYAGCLGRTYDLDTVLKAVAANPDFTLDIAGKWERGVPERVTAHGYLNQDELNRLLGECDVGIIPMNADSWVGIPYKMCDYAKAGLRIVSSLGGESAAFLRQYRCGESYRKGDVASLTAAIRKAMAGERGVSRQMCEREFDAQRIYAAYVERIGALVGR